MVASIMAADEGNTFNNPYDEEGDVENWGMVGVNTVSNLLVCVKDPTSVMVTEALNYFVRLEENKPQIVNFSHGGFPDEELPHHYILDDQISQWEDILTALIESEFDIPLLCVSSGNVLQGLWDENDGVAFPARFAFWGSREGFEKGYPFVMSVGASDYQNEKADYSVYTEGLNHVSVVAPGGNENDDPEDSSLLTGQSPLLNPNNRFFIRTAGTSAAAPLVAGIASLVLSAAIANEETLTPWEIRRIIEKTAIDINFGEMPYFDSEIGYGLVDCNAAVTHRDLYSWDLEDDSWYWISSNVNRIYPEIRRIMEDITLDNNTYVNGLEILKGWDPVNEESLVWEPGVSDDEFNWDVQDMIKIKLNDEADKYTNELLLCGQVADVDDDILLIDNGNIDGWNWVAYYPEYSAAAENVLTSIATPADPNSDLFMAKGDLGNFYSVYYQIGEEWFSFSNLTMEQGEGYMMQLKGDRNVTLNYPDEDPDLGPGKQHGGEKHLANTEHFHFNSRTGDFLPIIITGVSLENRNPGEGDEIGIFVFDTLCVGAAQWQEGHFGFAAWQDDETTPNFDGFRNINNLTFRYWDSSENEEIGQIGIRTDAVDEIERPSIWIKELTFDGPVRKPVIPSEFALGPIYPNPFNSTAIIHYELPSTEFVNLGLYDMDGRQIMTLFDGYSSAGSHRITLDGARFSSGTYFIKLETGNLVFTELIVLIK